MTEWGLADGVVVHEEDPVNVESAREQLAASGVTATGATYVRNHGPVPEVDPAVWGLRVDGLVDRSLDLGLDELRERFGRHEVTATMQCAGNRRDELTQVRPIDGETPWGPGAVSTTRWAGARLADVLAAAGVQEGAAHVAFQAPDVSELADPPQAFGGSVPLAKALAPETLLAWEMNAEPLPPLHGAPVRVVVPGHVGARSVKWVTRVRVQAEPSDNFFQARSYRVLPPDADPDEAGPGDGISLGPVALTSAILRPAPADTVPAGAVRVAGYAIAGEGRTVERVDVSVDGGRTWAQADLGPDQGRWAWRRWAYDARLEPGPAELVCRAWDSSAGQQPQETASLWNPKGYANTAWHRVPVQVVAPGGRSTPA